MRSHPNPHQLVLRLDSATGFAQIGWAADLPIGRFIHVQLIGEIPQCGPIYPGSPLFEVFHRACGRARQINQPLIAAQARSLTARGCLPVPLDLNDPDASCAADAFGSYRESAMGALFRLTSNFASVWAVVHGQTVVQLSSRRPPRNMEELEYQVWKRQILNNLGQYPGDISAGKLLVHESGLWFRAEQ